MEKKYPWTIVSVSTGKCIPMPECQDFYGAVTKATTMANANREHGYNGWFLVDPDISIRFTFYV